MLSLVPADTQATPSRGCRGEPYTGHGARRRRRRREKGTRAYARAWRSPRRSPVIASAILAGVLGGHARTYVPRLEILHHALNRNLVQQHEIADADVVGVRHLALFHSRTRDAHRSHADSPG